MTSALKGGTGHTEELFGLFLGGIDDPEVAMNTKSIHAIGLFLESTPQDFSRYILHTPYSMRISQEFTDISRFHLILSKLQRFFSNDGPRSSKESAIGCISRMILLQPQKIPLNLVFSKFLVIVV